ncbi:hypothetical protein CDAR_612501 [Caerostris darwini]|uniref:Uncharacterized protein n=1 Tax=Caerostris darwini TaxID=1538125 RepID=A0AAV4SK37_9ARAC|nr:hypothetical protein CDAR_612501 [Caerostris darwini]
MDVQWQAARASKANTGPKYGNERYLPVLQVTTSESQGKDSDYDNDFNFVTTSNVCLVSRLARFLIFEPPPRNSGQGAGNKTSTRSVRPKTNLSSSEKGVGGRGGVDPLELYPPIPAQNDSLG